MDHTSSILYTSVDTDVKELQNKISNVISFINIYRNNAYNCFGRAVNRKRFDPYNRLWVKFSDTEGITEVAVDLGDPTREMFRLLFHQIKDLALFLGSHSKNYDLTDNYRIKGLIIKLAGL